MLEYTTMLPTAEDIHVMSLNGEMMDKLTRTSQEVNIPQKGNHYEGFVDSYEWMDVFIRKYRNTPDIVRGALLCQIDKYYARYGKKDSTKQESLKGLWYAAYLAAWEANDCQPISASDVQCHLREAGHDFFQ